MTGGLFSRAFLVAALVVLLGWPTLATVLEAAGGEGVEPPGGGLIAPISEDAVPRPLRLAWRTIQLVALTETLALPVGVALAFVLFRTDAPGRRVWLAAMALLALVPMPLHATAWLGGFGNLGRTQAIGGGPILVGLVGAAVVHAIAAIPWIVFIVGVGLIAVEPELEDAARLDLPAWRVALAVTLRRSVGAIAGAALAVAVLTAGDMTVTDLLSVRTYAEEAYLQFQIGQGPASAASVALPPLVVLGVLLVLAGRRLLRSDPARLVSGSLHARPWRLGVWRIPMAIALVLVVGTLVGLPVYSLVWRAGRVGGDAALRLPPHWSASGLWRSLGEAAKAIAGPIGSQPLRSPLLSSLLWSTAAATLTVSFAWTLAWVSRRPGVWRWVAAISVALALAAPGPVAGMALVLAYRSVPLIYNSAAIVVLADVARVWPYAFLILWPALRSIPREYLDAAALDGCGPAGVVRRVAFPLTLGATLAAWGASFLLSMGELPASGLVAPPGVLTLPALIWSMLHVGVESRLAAIALLNLVLFALAVGLAAAAWGGLRLWLRRKSAV